MCARAQRVPCDVGDLHAVAAAARSAVGGILERIFQPEPPVEARPFVPERESGFGSEDFDPAYVVRKPDVRIFLGGCRAYPVLEQVVEAVEARRQFPAVSGGTVPLQPETAQHGVFRPELRVAVACVVEFVESRHPVRPADECVQACSASEVQGEVGPGRERLPRAASGVEPCIVLHSGVDVEAPEVERCRYSGRDAGA